MFYNFEYVFCFFFQASKCSSTGIRHSSLRAQGDAAVQPRAILTKSQSGCNSIMAARPKFLKVVKLIVSKQLKGCSQALWKASSENRGDAWKRTWKAGETESSSSDGYKVRRERRRRVLNCLSCARILKLEKSKPRGTKKSSQKVLSDSDESSVEAPKSKKKHSVTAKSDSSSDDDSASSTSSGSSDDKHVMRLMYEQAMTNVEHDRCLDVMHSMRTYWTCGN